MTECSIVGCRDIPHTMLIKEFESGDKLRFFLCEKHNNVMEKELDNITTLSSEYID